MPKFVVYEVWTQARVIEAKDETEAYWKGDPVPRNDGLSLCNWHVIQVTDIPEPQQLEFDFEKDINASHILST